VSARRRRLTLAYDGTDFAGWQVQPDQRTVQATVETALTSLLGEPVRVQGSGRTDAGVHALGQVAHFDDPQGWPLDRLQSALDATLPADVRVVAALEAAPDFHALHSARRKSYVYQFWRSPRQGGKRTLAGSVPPLFRRTHHACRADLDLAAMRRAAAQLCGKLDFTTLSKAMPAGRTTVKRVDAVRVLTTRHQLRLVVTGEGFLYGMVRLMAGLLLAIGERERAADDVDALLAARDRSLAPASLPAHGLLLWKVDYPRWSIGTPDPGSR
jgi:tRNA pseudouridine38-40 synthase